MSNATATRWKRGFFRLWVLVSTLWVLAVLALAQPWDAFGRYQEATDKLERFSSAFAKVDAKIAAGGGPSEDGTYYDVERLKGMREELETRQIGVQATVDGFPTQMLTVLSALIGVPLFVLGFGAALAWVIGGFKQGDTAKNEEPKNT